ncbi:MAG: DUF1624 domain-containing protein [bacterium]|nr:DUF1624 domain-containing protein [bacterium]
MPKRLISLDVFRGLTIAMMILVNNPGSWSHIYAPLRHANWHGWTPTDLIFPFFLFIVGVSLSLSFRKRISTGQDQNDLLKKAFTRAIVIFFLGLFLNGFPFIGGQDFFNSFRLWGVLQRIGVCYFLAAMAVILLPSAKNKSILVLSLILTYELGMRLPLLSGWADGSFALSNNFARWLDLQFPGETHLYAGTGIAFDPEGLWSTLNATVTTISGYFVGEFLNRKANLSSKIKTLALGGLGLAVTGQGLHYFEPINKQLWTTSYVVLTNGLAMLTLAFCIWIVDVKKWSRWSKPAVVFGSNALVVFVGSGVLARLLVLVRIKGQDGNSTSLKHHIYSEYFVSWAGPVNGSLAFALVFVLFWLGLLWILFARRIFIKV